MSKPQGYARFFPVGLYGLLLGCLCLLAAPRLGQPVERTALLVGALPLSMYTAALGSSGRPQQGLVDREAERIVDELHRRQEAAALGSVRALLPTRWQPVHCRVLSLHRERGEGRLRELFLDRSWRELSRCERLVTFGDGLVGFLAERGVGSAQNDALDDPARVLLIGHRDAPRLAAVLEDPDSGRRLQCVVAPTALVERWPLRCTLLDDPYLAVRVEPRRQEVRTAALDQRVVDLAVPAGLRLGTLRVFGYEGLPIGWFVAPEPAATSLATVIAWRRGGAAEGLADPFARGDLAPVRRLSLPCPGGQRWFISGAPAGVVDGAALIEGVRMVGRVRAFGGGQALAEPFGSLGQSWSVILLPDDPGRTPLTFGVRVIGRRGALVFLGGSVDLPVGRGHLFSGVHGEHSPAGLYLGAVLVLADHPRHVRLELATGGRSLRGQGVYRARRGVDS